MAHDPEDTVMLHDGDEGPQRAQEDEYDEDDEDQEDDRDDIYMQVDPAVANETNDFVDESILLLHILGKNKTNSKQWVSYVRDLNAHDSKHIILYNWVALSLVREAYADVAAVAVYSFPKKPSQVYYSKNNLNSSDKVHANELADLVRHAASSEMPIVGFQDQYFALMHRNCLPKLKCRVNNLRASLSFRGKPLKDENDKLVYTPSQGDQLRTLLQNAIDSNAPQPLHQNRPDVTAVKFVKDTNNVFVALLKVFDSMKVHVASEETALMLETLCAHCWMIGMSATLAGLARDKVGAQDVIIAAGKLGEYFQGTGYLYILFGDKQMRSSVRSFKLFAVPPMPDRRVELCKNWFHVIDTVYHRVNGRAIDITKAKLYSQLQTQVMAYAQFAGPFIRHAEVQLIEYLMSQNRSPTIIGISKFSCALCDQWIKAINDENYRKWKVSGCNGRMYPWARDVDAGPLTAAAKAKVKAFVYKEVVKCIKKFIPDGGESPAHPSVLDADPYADKNPRVTLL